MSTSNRLHSLRAFFLTLYLVIWLAPVLVFAESDDETAGIFDAWQDTAVSASRIPKPLSQTAESVTVIDSKDIKLLNAHTLADVLDTVPGIQIQHNGGPGITAYTYIQSANPFFSQIFIDGISINNLANNFPDVSAIPAQIIDRIEIVKGAGSSAWGSALGGIINVITKSPNKERAISGSASASIGTRTTADTRAELSGTTGKLGYYLSGGYLGSDGLLPTMQIDSRQAYSKLTYDLPNNGQVWGTFSYSSAEMIDLFHLAGDFRERHDTTRLLTSLGLRYNLINGLQLDIAGKYMFLSDDFAYPRISDGSPKWAPDSYKDKVNGVSAKLLWRHDYNLLAIGSDYNHLQTEYVDNYVRKIERWGVYLNDTLTLGPASISPSIRLDHTQTSGDQVSSALGLTWQASDKTLLRVYTGRGFNVPILANTDAPPLKIWTTQVGVESNAVPYLWVKGTLFRNLTWGDAVDVEKNQALGSELEVRTIPVFNTSLGAGWTYTDTTRTSDGTQVRPDRPTQTLKLTLRYDDSTYRGVLTGSHINWNAPPEYNAKYGGLVWDLHLGAMLLKRENSSLELFFSGHNIFNGNSYNRDLYLNASRWFDGGIRVNF